MTRIHRSLITAKAHASSLSADSPSPLPAPADRFLEPASSNINPLRRSARPALPPPPDWKQHGRVVEQGALYAWLGRQPRLGKGLIRRWYGTAFAERFLHATRFGRLDAWPLLADPGIADRAGEFVRFATARLAAHPETELLELRQAFSSYLGKVTLFRGMLLTEAEAKKIVLGGLDSPGARAGESGLAEWLKPGKQGPVHEITAKVTVDDENRGSVISTSEFKEIALGAASYREGRDPDLKLYLLTIDTALINTVWEHQRVATLSTAKKLQEARSEMPVLNVTIGPDNYFRDWGSGGAEVSLFHFLPADELRTIEPIQLDAEVRVDPWTKPLGGTYLESPKKPKREFEDPKDP